MYKYLLSTKIFIMKKHIIFLLMVFISFISRTQCGNYIIHESFTSTLPTQGGTWSSNSMIVLTSPVRTGTHSIGFNGTGDWVRTPQISNPGVLSFWYRRSANSTAWTLNIQTSPDGITWTTRGSITTITTTYTQYTLDIGSIGLTNVFIRLLDSRASGAHERYVDDLNLTSTVSSQNLLIPILSSCSQTLSSSLTYTLTDDGGPSGPTLTGYGNNINRTVTFSPSDNTKLLELSFTQLDLETGYDYLYVYDGPNTSSTLLATLNGTTIPPNITATNSTGQLTIRWTTDVSNVGTWGGFAVTINSTSPVSLPVDLMSFDGVVYPGFNLIRWVTASEYNSDYFQIERSTDGEIWKIVSTKTASGNSNTKVYYSYLDNIDEFTINYYILKQYDFDGKCKTYGPISLDNTKQFKKVLKYVDVFGREVDQYTNGLLFEL